MIYMPKAPWDTIEILQDNQDDQANQVNQDAQNAQDDQDDPTEAALIQELVDKLRTLSTQASCMARLHPVERMMLQDVLAESRHLRCTGCRRWLAALLYKAQHEPEDEE